jgi:hypothetical protein
MMTMSRATRLGSAAITLAAVILIAVPQAAYAVPTLQLYIENSTYNTTTETWEFTGNDVRLWVLGDVGHYGTISEVKLTVAFPSTETGTVSLTATTASAGQLPSPGDPSTSPTPSSVSNPLSAVKTSYGSDPGPCGSNGTDGTAPCMGNGQPLPLHGEYGPGTKWVEFFLGDFTLTDSPIGDYIQAPPTIFSSTGQINAYDVSLTGFTEGTEVHFDAFNHIVAGKKKLKYKFAPFSHDAMTETTPSVPEAPTFVLILTGVVAAGAWRRMRQAV